MNVSIKRDVKVDLVSCKEEINEKISYLILKD
jgi:hypothetical protein